MKRTFIIAEMSANHCGDLEFAKRTVEAAKRSGADAVKVQTYTADTMTLDCRREEFRIRGSGQWDGRYLHELYAEAAMPWAWHRELKDVADSIGIEFFSTPFDRTAVDFLEGIGVGRYKIASFEAVDLPLIRHAAAKGKPLIISTGICTPEEMQAAVEACREVGNDDVTLLKCTSSYPAEPESMHLATISDMIRRFAPQGVKIGLSDHTMTPETAVVAVSLGAQVVERHFTLDRSRGGADAAFSATPGEFKEMVASIRMAERLLGEADYAVNGAARAFRRSLFVCEDIRAGEIFTERNIRSIRPGCGCAPDRLRSIVGRRAKVDLARGTPMREEYVA